MYSERRQPYNTWAAVRREKRRTTIPACSAQANVLILLPGNFVVVRRKRTSTLLQQSSGQRNASNVQQLIVTPEASKLGLTAIYHVVDPIRSGPLPREFFDLQRAACAQLASEYTPEFIATDPIIQGFRALRTAIGRSPRKRRCSIESLIGIVHRRGELPAIHPVVDVYNLVSLETRLTLGAHDLDQVVGNITLRIVAGEEPFIPLGSDQHEPVQAGEYAYLDDAGDVLCRLDYKQCDKTKLTEATTRCLVILQGNANTPPELLERAKSRLAELLDEFGVA